MKSTALFDFFPLMAFPALALIASGCGGHRKALVVRSEPADAEVCIKGKANSEYFSNQKSCVGTTPFEAAKVLATNPDGKRQEVKFNDVDGDHESFYVVVSRPGYASEVLEVPDKSGQWDFNVSLRTEQAVAAAQVAAISAAPPAPAALSSQPHPAANSSSPASMGTVRVTSEPLGALVYLNGSLRGNSPYTYEGRGGESVSIKLELDGYKPIEKSFTLESQRNFVINFRLTPLIEGGQAQTVPSEPAAAKAPAAQAPGR